MNKRLLIIGLIGLLLLGVLVILTRTPESQPKASPVPTPTADPFAKDRTALVSLSEEFVQKFFTYQKPNDPAYFQSIKPYMTDQFFTENKRLTDDEPFALAHAEPVSSIVVRSEVTGLSEKTATARVEIRTTEDGHTYEQTILVNWVRQNERWRVNDVEVVENTKGSDNG